MLLPFLPEEKTASLHSPQPLPEGVALHLVIRPPQRKHLAADTRLFPLDGARRRNLEVDQWLASRPTELQAVARRWFEQMREMGSDVLDLVHDGHPTACVGGLAFGYVNAFRGHVNVGFFLGTSLDDPSNLLQGTGRFMRHVKVRPNQDLDENALTRLIQAAYEDMKARQPAS